MPINEASTQYDDAKGTVSIDWHGGTEIHDWAKDIGVPENYFALGVSLWLGEMHPQMAGHDQPFSVTIYAADKAEVGESAEEIISFAKEHGEVPVREFNGEVFVKDLSKYIKRFELVARSYKILGGAKLVLKSR